ncbi:hypothetical protein [Calothrix sp. UHCC 0171]|uniref:hypothetical protein n=1 Tax=Calothrix sp. UHCC 0171 TaxID=3110245 RepID=UPI002B200C1C|nr:hypothetical protein [Calothrix sp. UHCC 0171]MEA5570778.1 hypothetical protein [Calothrix sp. UHCC 0171]
MNLQYLKLIKWWVVGVVAMFLLTAGVGVAAFVYLTRSPEVANCQSDSLSEDAASTIIYCANKIADEQNAEKLSQAIRLANSIPKDNPLRPNAEQLIKKWSQALLNLSENAFHEGNLERAIKLVEVIPRHLTLYQSAKKQTQEWQNIWSTAEDIYKTVAAKIDEENDSKTSYLIFVKAQELKKLNNQYWASKKYQELIYNIQSAKESKEAKEKAEQEANLAKSETDSNPSIFDASQLQEDEAQLEKARTLANSSNIDDMRSALIEASMVISEGHRQQADKLIQTIEHKIATSEDSSYLDSAKKLAAKNDAISLEMAINEASLIGKERPLYQQANQQMALWKQKKSLLESQPQKLLVVNNSKSNISQSDNQVKRLVNISQVSDSTQIKINASKKFPQINKTERMNKMPSFTQLKVNEIPTDFVRLEELENKQIQELQP